MRIIVEPKYNFEDVLLLPKRSTLSSRKEVDITREFKFRNSKKVKTFTPIFASNMSGIGTFSMAKSLQEYNMITVIGKTKTPDDWKVAFINGVNPKNVSVCTGTSKTFDDNAEDYANMEKILNKYTDIDMITVDVANAYHQNMIGLLLI